MANARLSSSTPGYTSGMLSLYPEALDDFDSLYQATNDSIVPLKQTLTFSGTRIIVEDTTGFPDSGIVRVGPDAGEAGQYELVYYGRKTRWTFERLVRGFGGSRQGHWEGGGKHFVSNSVSADAHHNAVKDALINMQTKIGPLNFPPATSLNGILKAQETRFLAPKPLFRAFPISGPPSLKVRFQNFSTGHIVKYLWDFGDGSTSLDESPAHTYLSEGIYTVKLNVVTSTGAQGVATKINYITVDADESQPFFYVESISDPYSQETADAESEEAKEFVFVDQSDGDVVQRNWLFGDGTTHVEEDADVHTATHVYDVPGDYNVSLLVQFANGRLKRVELPDTLSVI